MPFRRTTAAEIRERARTVWRDQARNLECEAHPTGGVRHNDLPVARICKSPKQQSRFSEWHAGRWHGLRS